jgi:hypothetical protein
MSCWADQPMTNPDEISNSVPPYRKGYFRIDGRQPPFADAEFLDMHQVTV